jgi:hypothetical protein
MKKTVKQRQIAILLKSVRRWNWYRKISGYKRLNLTDANLTRANLTDADLTYADLTRANLTDANLTRANLTDADLTRANLTRANLTRANLTRADLTRANLTRANLTRANLTRANLTRADLDYSTLPLWCGSLKTKFDQKHIYQILFHSAKPCYYNPEIAQDGDLKNLLNSDLFKKVANKFHRAKECGEL